MVRFKDPTIEIEGKSGGDIWRYDWCKQHLQAFPRMIGSEPSAAQKIRRRAFRQCLNLIKQWSTVDFVHRWQAYAYRHPITNKKGERHALAWWTQFIKTNINRIVEGKEPLQFPPDN